ncbi:TonB-dependent receptor [Corallincola holothuriorum]|uniref:TonB-dependent receptor n=1 Tax=Corallincola holothuriorum TaxID=2282215 RepID=A0A368NID7_9GAMM|nr:TonB-dependent receptor [Corallincola holothuriorum]RCU49404.1 TonB-dependent receptor [Corallincola holothuriorum]
MYTSSKLAKAVRLAMIGGAFASAATAVPAYAADEEVERIEVTGSRIKRTDLETASPVSIISAQDLMEKGITRIDDALRQMTSTAGAALGTNVNNGSVGKAEANMRGLGSERTLVLVNGRRFPMSGTGANASVDLNNIPVTFIKRIEVLKDGASAVYGSDAIAGVINVILKDDFEGFQFDAQYGETFENDGEEGTLSATLGQSFDRGHFVVNATYYDKKEVRQSDRDFSECPIFEFLDLDGDGKYDKFCGGSSGTIGGRGNLVDANGDGVGGQRQWLPGGQSLGEVGAGGQSFKDYSFFEDSYNYASSSYLDTPQSRVQLNFNGKYDVADDISVFAEGMYTNRRSKQQMAPTRPDGLGTSAAGSYYNPTTSDGWFAENGFFNDVNGDGVWNDADEFDATMNTRRMTDIGPRKMEQEVDTFRLVTGFNGTFDAAERTFDWEVFYQYARNNGTAKTKNQVNKERFAETMDESVCVEGGNGVDQVPCANWFGVGHMTDDQLAAAANYVSYTEVDTGDNSQELYGANISGEVFELPAGMMGFAFGVEHRRETGSDNPDVLSQYGIGGGNAALPTEGEYDVNEGYLELAIPVLADLPGVERLDMTAAMRYFDYSTFGSDSTWNLGATWTINENFMIRSKYTDQAFRAPSIPELFGGQGDSYEGYSDPCSNWQTLDPNSNTYQNCMADLGGAYEQQDGQVRAIAGGNEDLSPEVADIFTAGFVADFDGLFGGLGDGLSLTVDYYSIEIDDAISQIDPTTKLNQCYASADGGIGGSGSYCNDFTRLADGEVDGILYLDENASKLETAGIDFNVRYNFQATGLDWTVTWDTTWVDKFEETSPDGTKLDYVGVVTFGSGSTPEWKSNLALQVAGDKWDAFYQIRYIDSMTDELKALYGEDPADYENPGSLEVDEVWYHDASVGYNVLDNVRIQAGVNNLWDEEPPYYTSYNDSNTDLYTYDLVGRRWYLSTQINF